jgi:putative membrane protein insertion efficiency factor
MGPGDSSAPLGGAGEFYSARSGAAGTAAKSGPLSHVLARILLAGIRVYQAVLAPLMPVGCKFYPTCSHYAYEAIARHGARRGAYLAAARLLRCRPFTKGGHDPVPDADDGGSLGGKRPRPHACESARSAAPEPARDVDRRATRRSREVGA